MSTPGDNESSERRERGALPDCLTSLLRHEGIAACHLGRLAAPAAPKTYVHVLAAIWVQLDRLAELTGECGGATSKFVRRH
jgi:hypothetical protein